MLSSRWNKKDAYGQTLKPGDICARSVGGKPELIIYKGDSWGGNKSRGEFGRFITPDGPRSVKYTNVLFAFDPIGTRHTRAEQVTKIVREFYEEK